MERRLSLALAGTGLLAALLLVTAGHKRAVPGAEIEAVAADLDALVRETAAGVQARADTLSQLPRLGWIVATDAATVGDLTADELEFRPRAGEHIELAQVRKSDGQIRVLRRLPAASALPLPVSSPPGSQLLLAEGRIQVVTIRAIQPRARAGELGGALAVAQVLDTAAVAQRLDTLGVGARLQTPGGSATLGHGAKVVGSSAVVVPLKSPVARGAVLVASPGSGGWWGRAVLWAILALTLGGASVLWRRGGRARSSRPAFIHPPSPSPSSSPSSAPAGGVPLDDDEGESELTFDPDATVLADAVPPSQLAISRARTGSVPILMSPSGPGPKRTRTPAPSAAGESVPITDEYRALFVEYLSLRRTCGEPIIDLDREDFVETLRSARARLIREDGVTDVRFRLAFANGKAVIRFTTVP